MRITTLLTLPLLGALVALPAKAPAQINVRVEFGARLGPEVGVFAYSQDHMGDWRSNYRHWKPVTLYDVNGHYYRTEVRGSRPVVVYTYNDEYFLPPQDRAWIGIDHRYNYDRRPTSDDEGRVRPYAARVQIDSHLGAEIGLFDFSAERAGDWRSNYTRWTPTTVYEVNGHYYPHNAPGARAVSIYRYHNEYFLPPRDREFAGFDKRFDYKHQPSDDDRRRAHGNPDHRQ